MSSKPLHWIVIFTFLACSQICLSFETVPLAPIDEIWTPPSKHEVGYYKALKILNKLKQNLLLKKKDKVIASTCRTSLILSEFLDQKELHSPTHTPNTSKIALDKPPKNLHAILQVIRETVLGRAILKKFYPRYGFDIKIKYQPKEQIRKLTKNMALASYDPMKKVIHIDKSGETGKIAYVLLHELFMLWTWISQMLLKNRYV